MKGFRDMSNAARGEFELGLAPTRREPSGRLIQSFDSVFELQNTIILVIYAGLNSLLNAGPESEFTLQGDFKRTLSEILCYAEISLGDTTCRRKRAQGLTQIDCLFSFHTLLGVRAC
jgi:hypothetical protein